MLTSEEEALLKEFKAKMLKAISAAHPDQIRIIHLKPIPEHDAWWIDGEMYLDGYDKFVFSAVYSPRESVDSSIH